MNIPHLIKFVLIFPIFLLGCGKQTAEDVRNNFSNMEIDKLKAEAVRLREECWHSHTQSYKSSSTCARLNLAEEVSAAKGWCWGPKAAANSSKSWMLCEDDVTSSARASGPWYAETKSRTCRQTETLEAISKVLEHDGPWNIKTSFSKAGFLDISSRLKDGGTYSIRLYPTCASALMVYITKPGSVEDLWIAAPLGMSPKDAAEFFRFDVSSCSVYSIGNGLGCRLRYELGSLAPVILSDGFTPCSNGRQIQFDFLPIHGMSGVTCSLTPELKELFLAKMAATFGSGERRTEETLRWTLGIYTVDYSEYEVLGNTMRKFSVYQKR